jgi:hypothetical protein
MSSIQRKLSRGSKKNNGTLTHKKKVARKLGCSLTELDKRLKRRENNLRKLEDRYGE